MIFAWNEERRKGVEEWANKPTGMYRWEFEDKMNLSAALSRITDLEGDLQAHAAKLRESAKVFSIVFPRMAEALDELAEALLRKLPRC